MPPRRAPAPASPPRPEIVVLGAGIIGLACARELARFGARVEVVDRHRHGSEASTTAAGMLSPLVETHGEGPFFEACRHSRDLWTSWQGELSEESGLDLDYDDSGALMVALNDADEEALEGYARAAAELGEAAEEVKPAEARRWVPELSPKTRRALLLKGEHRVDNVKALAALAAAAEKAGVKLTHGKEVVRVVRTPGGVRLEAVGWRREAEILVLAAGAWTGALDGLPPLPVRPLRGQMLLLGGVEWGFNGIVRNPHLYTVRRGMTGLLVGATSEETGFECHNTVAGLASLLAFTRRLLPGLDPARVETTWAGLRPATPDGRPVLGRLGDLPVVVASGHQRNGILLAPWTARQVARIVLDGEEAPPELAPFAPGRFGDSS